MRVCIWPPEILMALTLIVETLGFGVSFGQLTPKFPMAYQVGQSSTLARVQKLKRITYSQLGNYFYNRIKNSRQQNRYFSLLKQKFKRSWISNEIDNDLENEITREHFRNSDNEGYDNIIRNSISVFGDNPMHGHTDDYARMVGVSDDASDLFHASGNDVNSGGTKNRVGVLDDNGGAMERKHVPAIGSHIEKDNDIVNIITLLSGLEPIGRQGNKIISSDEQYGSFNDEALQAYLHVPSGETTNLEPVLRSNPSLKPNTVHDLEKTLDSSELNRETTADSFGDADVTSDNWLSDSMYDRTHEDFSDYDRGSWGDFTDGWGDADGFSDSTDATEDGFSEDDSGCLGIDDRECDTKSECSCYGLYTCNTGRCKLYENDDTSIDSALGKWENVPFEFADDDSFYK